MSKTIKLYKMNERYFIICRFCKARHETYWGDRYFPNYLNLEKKECLACCFMNRICSKYNEVFVLDIPTIYYSAIIFFRKVFRKMSSLTKRAKKMK